MRQYHVRIALERFKVALGEPSAGFIRRQKFPGLCNQPFRIDADRKIFRVGRARGSAAEPAVLAPPVIAVRFRRLW